MSKEKINEAKKSIHQKIIEFHSSEYTTKSMKELIKAQVLSEKNFSYQGKLLDQLDTKETGRDFSKKTDVLKK